MVAIIIFGVGMLWLALLQIKGAQFTKESGSRSNAVLAARGLADAMRANPLAIEPVDGSESYYVYDGTSAPDASGCANDPCKQAKADLVALRANLDRGTVAAIGSPRAAVSRDADLGTFTVSVSWNGLDANGDKALTSADNATFQFSFLP
jgi:type IV pilus assembly protein PilV